MFVPVRAERFEFPGIKRSLRSGGEGRPRPKKGRGANIPRKSQEKHAGITSTERKKRTVDPQMPHVL